MGFHRHSALPEMASSFFPRCLLTASPLFSYPRLRAQQTNTNILQATSDLEKKSP